MNERRRRVIIADAAPNADLLLEFLDHAVWDGLCVEHGEDFDRLREVLATAMMTWNLCVLRARGEMPDRESIRGFLAQNARFFEFYSKRKDSLFSDDERLFIDVKIELAEDGRPAVYAMATGTGLDRSAPFMPRSLPRTRTERNRAKRARQRV